MAAEDDWLVQAAEQEAGTGIPHPAHDRDNFSFEDSDRFEGDSECSWVSNESLNQNWRGWANSSGGDSNTIQPNISSVYPYHYAHSGRYSSSSTNTVVHNRSSRSDKATSSVLSLAEISARVCAEELSFDLLEYTYQEICRQREKDDPCGHISHSVPDKIFLAIIFWCFPGTVDDIRLYSCLANGNADEFNHGDSLYQIGAVRDVVQIGYLVSAVVCASSQECEITSYSQNNVRPTRTTYNVSLRVDRCRVVSCACSCDTKSAWCQHVVALCLFRLNQPNHVQYRVTIWDSVNELPPAKLKKFAQYLINELPREYLPIAQQLLDQLKDPLSEINQSAGAPDPTDGGHEQVAIWALDEQGLHTSIRRLLIKYCVPAPSVHCDVQYLCSAQHPIALEWQTLLKPLRSREPEGLWNLISIVREMLSRRDNNAISLLRIMTEECLANTQVLLWWYVTRLVQGGNWIQLTAGKNAGGSQMSAQLNCSQLCDEVVSLWRCVALNPTLSNQDRIQLAGFLQHYHRTAVIRTWTVICGTGLDASTVSSSHQSGILLNSVVEASGSGSPLSEHNAHFSLSDFPGFHPALLACHALSEESVVPGHKMTVLHLPESTHEDDIHCVPIQPLPCSYPTQKKPEKGKKKRKKIRSRWLVSDQTSRQSGNFSLFNDEVSLDRAVIHVVAAITADRRNRDAHKDDSSESGQESDVQVNQPHHLASQKSFPQEEVDGVLAAAYLPMEPVELRFARCEALAAHGFVSKAISLAVQLTHYLLENLITNLENDTMRLNKADKPGCSRDEDARLIGETTVLKSQRFVETIEKALCLAHILRVDHLQHSILFIFVLNVLQIPKHPMATKFLQVKLYYLECELVALLQQVGMGPSELEQLRDVAVRLSETISYGTVPPIALAHFILDRLSYTSNICELDQSGQSSSRVISNRIGRKPCDDELALRAALDALGARSLFAESDFPLLSEAVRRQKGELAVALLTRHKDSNEKLGLVLDKLLDPSIHRMYSWHQSNAAYFLDRDPIYLKHCQRGQRPVYPYSTQESTVIRSVSIQSSDSRVAFDEEFETLTEQLKTVGRSPRRSSDEGNDSSRSSPCSSLQNKHLCESVSLPVESSEPIPCITSHKRLKRRLAPTILATEAHAHYMHELAKRVLTEAGGSQSTVVFAPIGPNPLMQGSNRKLHMCAFLIGIYALGLHNKVSPSWRSRTYSTHVSWLSLQVTDIGLMAVEVVRDTWESHLTPAEAAGLADKAGQSREPAVIEEAARLALSVLPQAFALSPAETQRALLQCREQGTALLEAACRAVEAAAEHETVFSDVLFRVGHHWYDLHCELDNAQAVVTAVPPAQPVSSAGVPLYHQAAPCHIVNTGHLPPPQYYYSPPHPPQSQIMYIQGQNVPVSMAGTLTVPGVENSRLHQSRSAPQLSVPRNGGDITRSRLVHAHRVGMRALDTMASQMHDDSRQYSKYSQTPPYADDLRWLFSVSAQLGTVYVLNFLEGAAKAIASPFLLYQFAMESFNRFPPTPYQQFPVPPMNRPISHPHNVSKAFQNVAGWTRTRMLQQCFHPSTAELYERCIEQFYAAAGVKLSHNRFSSSDMEDAVQLVSAAAIAIMRVPIDGRNMLDDFLRHVKKQKACKKDVQHRIMTVVHEALNQQR